MIVFGKCKHLTPNKNKKQSLTIFSLCLLCFLFTKSFFVKYTINFNLVYSHVCIHIVPAVIQNGWLNPTCVLFAAKKLNAYPKIIWLIIS